MMPSPRGGSLTDRFAALHDDESGNVWLNVLGVMLGPIVFGMIALTAISFMLTGGNFTQLFSRSAETSLLIGEFRSSIAGATAVSPVSATSFTVYDQPSMRTAFYMLKASNTTTCTECRWSVTGAGAAQTLNETVIVHSADSCNSAVKSTRVATLDGGSGLSFAYASPYGRAITAAAGVLTLGPGTQPADASDKAWASTLVATVTLTGSVSRSLGSSDLNVSADSPLIVVQP